MQKAPQKKRTRVRQDGKCSVCPDRAETPDVVSYGRAMHGFSGYVCMYVYMCVLGDKMGRVSFDWRDEGVGRNRCE